MKILAIIIPNFMHGVYMGYQKIGFTEPEYWVTFAIGWVVLSLSFYLWGKG